MVSFDKQKIIFRNLIVKSMDGQITEQEVQRLNTLLADYPQLQDYYVKCIQLHAALCEIQEFKSSEIGDSPLMDDNVWLELAEYEKTASEIEIPEQEHQPELIQKVIYTKIPHHISKFSIYSFIVSAAALLLIVLFVKFAPERAGQKVAIVAETMNAQWGNSSLELITGTPLKTGMESLILREGLVRVTYNSGASVVIEAPAEFMMTTEDELELYQGKLYASVPSEAIGFSVNTTNARIIDLGTEFGIYTPMDGEAELHVFKGKTSLISGFNSPGQSRKCLDVLAGQARRVQRNNSEIEEIELRTTAFARTFNSKTGSVWRGTPLSLANIVSGGNGFTGGKRESGIDPSSGAAYPVPREKIEPLASTSYIAVKDNPFIDGVFIPNGERGVNQITSAGHTFNNFSTTDGFYYTDITAYPYVVEIQGKNADETPKDKVESKLKPIFLDGVESNKSCIFLHPNAGITFDLEAIRSANPTFDLTGYTAECVPSSVWERKAEFWVLLDGSLVFHCTADEARESEQVIDVQIRSYHKFLTLATTDGQDGKAYDWCLFMEPEIQLMPVKQSTKPSDQGMD